MTIGQFYVLVASLAFLAIFITGRRLARGKTPHNASVLAAHKFLSLAAAALVAVIAVRVSKESGLAVSDWLATAAAVAVFVAAATTGGLQSVRQSRTPRLRAAHRATAVLTILAASVSLYFLLVRV